MGSTEFFLQPALCLGGSKPTFSVAFALFRELQNLHVTVPFNKTHVVNITELPVVNILIQTEFV